MVSGTHSNEDLKYLNLRVKKELIQARFELEQLKVNNMLSFIELKLHRKEKEERIAKARADQREIWDKIKQLKEKDSKRESKFVPGVGGYIEELEEQIKIKDAEKELKHQDKAKLKEIRAIQRDEL